MNIRSDNKIPDSVKGYVSLNGEAELSTAIQDSLNQLLTDEISQLKKLGDTIYAPGKWTINEILQHLIDTERILSYRALRFARKDQTPVAGFEENEYAPVSNANNRSFDSLLEELKAVRKSTQLLFESFTDEMLLSRGIANEREISVLALGFSITGHQKHHFKVMREKYLPLL